jgi:hypothetical protein
MRLIALIAAWLAVVAAPSWAQAQPEPVTPLVNAISGKVALDEVVEVRVERLAEWAAAPGNSPWRLVLYLDGRALRGLYPIAVDLRTNRLQFYLRSTPDSATAWNSILRPFTLSRPVRLSVGLEHQDPFKTVFKLEDHPATLMIVRPQWALASFVILSTFITSFVWLSLRTRILMDNVRLPDGSTGLRFSLAKGQLAIWFFVIFTTFLMIWLATGNYDTINSSIVGTLGISAGTAIGDAYIRSSQAGSPAEAPPGPKLLVPEFPGWKPWSIAAHLRRMVRDMICDADGYSIYRFQILAWTAVLPMVFIFSVYYDLTMPAFRPELLYLLGLSSGTFVAHRVPEAQREARNSIAINPTRIAAAEGTPGSAARGNVAAGEPPLPHATPGASSRIHRGNSG